MTQYSPYTPPGYTSPYAYSYGQPDLLAPARRAALLMFILGGVGMLCGLCIGMVVWIVPLDGVIAQAGIELPQTPGVNLSPEQLLRMGYTIIAVLGVMVSLALILLGVFVRRGGMGAAVTSLVLISIIVLLLLVNAFGVVTQVGLGTAAAPAALAMAIAVGMLGLFVLLLVWLIQAARNASAIKAQRLQYQWQWWQYQQARQMYGQGAPSPPSADYGGSQGPAGRA